jgi:hypothetical protein
VQGKHGGHQQTPSSRTGDAQQHEEEQYHVERVQQNIGEMMAPWVQSVKLTIQRMRKLGERMPILSSRGGQGPRKRLPSQSCLYVRVFDNVIWVVGVYEWIAHGGAVPDHRGEGEAKTGDKGKVSAFSIHRTA